MNLLKVANLELAHSLLAAGRQPDFVKRITGITIIEMVRQKWVYELQLPDPIRPGQVVRTGQFRSIFPQSARSGGKSNRQMKREDRKGFFMRRRLGAA